MSHHPHPDPSSHDPSIFETHYESFQAEVVEASHKQPILVDFWADWCGPCHALTPHLKRVIEEHEGRILLAKVEVDEGENMRLAGHYKVRGFPTVVLFQAGEERGRFSGARSRYQINAWLQEHLTRGAPCRRAVVLTPAASISPTSNESRPDEAGPE